jgi:hypothetical protein
VRLRFQFITRRETIYEDGLVDVFVTDISVNGREFGRIQINDPIEEKSLEKWKEFGIEILKQKGFVNILGQKLDYPVMIIEVEEEFEWLATHSDPVIRALIS